MVQRTLEDLRKTILEKKKFQFEQQKSRSSRDYKEMTLAITLLAGLSAVLYAIVDYFNKNTVIFCAHQSAVVISNLRRSSPARIAIVLLTFTTQDFSVRSYIHWACLPATTCCLSCDYFSCTLKGISMAYCMNIREQKNERVNQIRAVRARTRFFLSGWHRI